MVQLLAGIYVFFLFPVSLVAILVYARIVCPLRCAHGVPCREICGVCDRGR